MFNLVDVQAQLFNPYQTKKITYVTDTIVLDSLSLVPGSVSFQTFPVFDTLMNYRIDYRKHALIFPAIKPDSLIINYQRFPYNFEKKYFNKDARALAQNLYRPDNPFLIQFGATTTTSTALFEKDGLSKNGNISRGINFGTTQDVVVNSNLNLQVSGKLTQDIDLLLAATDNNIPFQADGTTAQLQEFDKVFVQINNANNKLIVGDYQLSKPSNGYFMNYYKRAQGGYFENRYVDTLKNNKQLKFTTSLAGAVSRGKFSRMVFFGIENNQGPYRLRGSENELFIIVLSGTEKIYIDGKLLQRGQENDYIIDYNTGEITFTAKQQITKDKRIVCEFQYAERNYARSLTHFSENVEFNKGTVYLNFFSEQDNKNRPLQQSLTQPQKNILINVGDTLSKAIASGAELAQFNNSDVFYWKKDSLVNSIVYKDVYVYSTNADSAKYRLKFSNVGINNGNYIQELSNANGRVYKWLAPINGVPQGNFEPIIPLVTPKQQQMVTAGINYSFTPLHVINIEGAYTKNDINRFSKFDKGNDEAGGFKFVSKNFTFLKPDSSKQKSKFFYNLSYEYVQNRFNQIERFRSIEFERDWNRPLSSLLINDQHISNADVGLVSKKGNLISYNISSFNEGTNYSGIKHGAVSNYKYKKFGANYIGSFLQTNDGFQFQKTEFYRHKISISQTISKIKFAFNDEFENNLFKKTFSDSLLPRAYNFWEWEGSASTTDTTKIRTKLFYKERRDKLNYGNSLKDSTFAQNIGLQTSIYAIKNNPISLFVTYRKLELKNTVGSFLKPDNTVLGRLEYNPRYFKGLITASLFYEAGYGLENRREFYYIEVAPGQGQYSWIDYNGDKQKQLNEFEIAQFTDQARFIRIYTPTNSYIKVLQNQLSLTSTLRPSSVIKSPKNKIQKLITRFVLQTTYRRDNKTTDNRDNNNYNPFFNPFDTLVLAANNNLRASVFFNQSSAVFGADYVFTNNKNRQLLVNGIETKTLYNHELRLRLNFLRDFTFNSVMSYGDKGNTSAFFSVRNYLINGTETENKLSYQPNTQFRVSGIYKYIEKKNSIKDGFQKAFINNVALELKYNQAEKGSLIGRADFVLIKYNDIENSAIAYEMLSALNIGRNFTWELTYQRNLNNNIQVSINYNGRKTATGLPVHLGGAQIRAFF